MVAKASTFFRWLRGFTRGGAEHVLWTSIENMLGGLGAVAAPILGSDQFKRQVGKFVDSFLPNELADEQLFVDALCKAIDQENQATDPGKRRASRITVLLDRLEKLPSHQQDNFRLYIAQAMYDSNDKDHKHKVPNVERVKEIILTLAGMTPAQWADFVKVMNLNKPRPTKLVVEVTKRVFRGDPEYDRWYEETIQPQLDANAAEVQRRIEDIRSTPRRRRSSAL